MKKHIWKKSFSISFVFHFIVVITIGAMVAGFHQETHSSCAASTVSLF